MALVPGARLKAELMILRFRTETDGRFAAASISFQRAPDYADVFR